MCRKRRPVAFIEIDVLYWNISVHCTHLDGSMYQLLGSRAYESVAKATVAFGSDNDSAPPL